MALAARCVIYGDLLVRHASGEASRLATRTANLNGGRSTGGGAKLLIRGGSCWRPVDSTHARRGCNPVRGDGPTSALVSARTCHPSGSRASPLTICLRIERRSKRCAPRPRNVALVDHHASRDRGRGNETVDLVGRSTCQRDLLPLARDTIVVRATLLHVRGHRCPRLLLHCPPWQHRPRGASSSCATGAPSTACRRSRRPRSRQVVGGVVGVLVACGHQHRMRR